MAFWVLEDQPNGDIDNSVAYNACLDMDELSCIEVE